MDNKVLLIILAILLPPLAAFLKTKDVVQTIITLVLCFLGLIPGIAYALWLVLK